MAAVGSTTSSGMVPCSPLLQRKEHLCGIESEYGHTKEQLNQVHVERNLSTNPARNSQQSIEKCNAVPSGVLGEELAGWRWRRAWRSPSRQNSMTRQVNLLVSKWSCCCSSRWSRLDGAALGAGGEAVGPRRGGAARPGGAVRGPPAQLRQVADAVVVEMHAGLATEGGGKLGMIISYVDSLPSGDRGHRVARGAKAFEGGVQRRRWSAGGRRGKSAAVSCWWSAAAVRYVGMSSVRRQSVLSMRQLELLGNELSTFLNDGRAGTLHGGYWLASHFLKRTAALLL
ncbi:hypothetical protein ACQ4PT_069662 [Festuca glaucescens]